VNYILTEILVRPWPEGPGLPLRPVRPLDWPER